MRIVLAAALVAAPAGCLGPLVSDRTGTSGQLLPAGSTVPRADDDPKLAAQLQQGETVHGVLPILSGFANGAPTTWWDFGVVPAHTSPMFVLVDSSGAAIDHPEIVDFAPGDDGYAPFWTLWHVEVTDAYEGQLITSVAALDEARAAGLVKAPVATGTGEHGPIVTRDVQVALADGTDFAADDMLYYRGTAVGYFELGDVPLGADHVSVQTGRRYVLSREGGAPLNEVIRQVDMDGDGDIVDSNDVMSAFDSPARTTVNVTVVSTVSSIDTTHDQTMADLRAESQMFSPQPVTTTVVAVDVTDELLDLPAVVVP